MAKGWALILGASSGFGAAAARALAADGYSIIGVHLDRRSGMAQVDALKAELEGLGVKQHFFNINAADAEKINATAEEIAGICADGPKVTVLMHSLAFGTLGGMVGEKALTAAQMDMTLRVMAHSLVDWTQALVKRDLLQKGGRVFAMTSTGSMRAIPNYGAVGAAKAALEAHCRQLAVELAPLDIAVNALRGGVTDTPALRRIPGHERLMDLAIQVNPYKRLTTPEDVAQAMVALCAPGAYWITGNVINVDGGEAVTG
ncbi:MAG TPA: SDR family oxidoreductase [Longimicrobiales bacterium]|nr:SDR family oxidoreductase [Longimicrobiales bacterium]